MPLTVQIFPILFLQSNKEAFKENFRGIELSHSSTGLGSTNGSKNDILTMIFSDFQHKSFADPKPVDL